MVNLYTANADGSNAKKLDPGNKPDRYFPIEPKYSRDGKKILFVSRDEGLYGPKGIAYVMNRDGSDLKAITQQDENVFEAVFSSDDQKVYYLRSGVFKNSSPIAAPFPHDFDVYVISVSGGLSTQVTTYNDYNLKGLSLSPDGKLLASGFRVLALNNGLPTIVDVGSCSQESLYQFYPREKFVLCIASDFDGKGIMYKMALEGTETEWKPISVQQTYSSLPVFFHSKNTILFFEHDGAFPQKLFSLNLDEPLFVASPLPDADRDQRTREIPIIIP